MQRLDRIFFQKPTLEVARKILGKCLFFQGKVLRISEVEAYIGETDPACHAVFGKTERNKIMYGEAGRSYIYLCYGTYWMLNFVTEKENFPAAILLRGGIPLIGFNSKQKLDGPGKITKALGLNKKQNNFDFCNFQQNEFLLFDDHKIAKDILATSRIGIKVGTEKLWRFLASDFEDR